MTHGLERHATRNLIRILGFRLGVSLLLGGGDEWVDNVVMLGALDYMRSDEEAADKGALVLLINAGIDPASLAGAFERLERQTSELPGALKYLSTHPPLSHRIAAVKQASPPGRRWTSALSPPAWRDLRSACDCDRN
jgi:predicted Zn-dependent protease